MFCYYRTSVTTGESISFTIYKHNEQSHGYGIRLNHYFSINTNIAST